MCKKLLSLLLVAAMMAGCLFACGGDGEGGGGGSGTAGASGEDKHLVMADSSG